MSIADFSYLWTTDKDKFVLEKYGEDYAIIDPINERMLLIEDDDIYDEIVLEMIKNGVEVVVKNKFY